MNAHFHYKSGEVRDQIFAGEISEQLNDPKRDAAIVPVQVSANTKFQTVGRNKSGCIWKKGTSSKSGLTNASLKKKSWDQKMEERKKEKALKIRLNELREARISAKRDNYRRMKEKQARK